jgi:hypothetical protein
LRRSHQRSSLSLSPQPSDAILNSGAQRVWKGAGCFVCARTTKVPPGLHQARLHARPCAPQPAYGSISAPPQAFAAAFTPPHPPPTPPPLIGADEMHSRAACGRGRRRGGGCARQPRAAVGGACGVCVARPDPDRTGPASSVIADSAGRAYEAQRTPSRSSSNPLTWPWRVSR